MKLSNHRSLCYINNTMFVIKIIFYYKLPYAAAFLKIFTMMLTSYERETLWKKIISIKV